VAVEWLKSLAEIWERGSLLLWGVAAAALAALIVAGAFTFFWPNASTSVVDFIPQIAVGSAALVVLAAFKTYQERSVRTLVFVTNVGQSFFHLAPQNDGRELTQVALRGRATNTSTAPIYLADVRLVSPRGRRTVHKHIFTQAQNNSMFGSDHVIPSGHRAELSADFFIEGFVGDGTQEQTFVIAVSDQLGHWHRVRFAKLRHTGRRPSERQVSDRRPA
jgi:hypothetical protein